MVSLVFKGCNSAYAYGLMVVVHLVCVCVCVCEGVQAHMVKQCALWSGS